MATAMPRASALTFALDELVDATDALTIAVERHDLVALVAASDRAEVLTVRVDSIAAELNPVDRIELDGPRIAELTDRLAVGARRNAYLIERAWALDAATMRMLVGLGQERSDGLPGERPGSGYMTAAAPALYLDREA
jgi:hypothetical protein